jgi:hypothetical protein
VAVAVALLERQAQVARVDQVLLLFLFLLQIIQAQLQEHIQQAQMVQILGLNGLHQVLTQDN